MKSLNQILWNDISFTKMLSLLDGLCNEGGCRELCLCFCNS